MENSIRRGDLIREANRLLRQVGYFKERDSFQLAFERKLVSIPTGGQPRRKCRYR